MSEGCRRLRAPKTHKIRLGKGEQVSQILIQFEKSNFNCNVSLEEPSTFIYSVEGRSFIKAKVNEKAFENAAQTSHILMEKCDFSTTSHKSYTPIHTSLLCSILNLF